MKPLAEGENMFGLRVFSRLRLRAGSILRAGQTQVPTSSHANESSECVLERNERCRLFSPAVLKPLNFWKHTIYLYVRPGSFLPAAAAALQPWPCDGHPRNWQANTELSPPP